MNEKRKEREKNKIETTREQTDCFEVRAMYTRNVTFSRCLLLLLLVVLRRRLLPSLFVVSQYIRHLAYSIVCRSRHQKHHPTHFCVREVFTLFVYVCRPYTACTLAAHSTQLRWTRFLSTASQAFLTARSHAFAVRLREHTQPLRQRIHFTLMIYGMVFSFAKDKKPNPTTTSTKNIQRVSTKKRRMTRHSSERGRGREKEREK